MSATDEREQAASFAEDLPGADGSWPDRPARDADVFLLDGNNLAYRAFWAAPPTSARSDGLPTGAIAGFASILARLLSDYRPRALVCAWDSRPQRRRALDGAYKSHRQAPPAAFRAQLPHLPRIAEAFCAANVAVAGEEADDVLASLARLASEAALRACVVTSDRDAYQIVSATVCVLSPPVRAGEPMQVYTPARVFRRLGVWPEQVPDYLGLAGDRSDGIPGVPGIGAKGASELLARFGSLEETLARRNEVAGARGRKLADHADLALRCKELATLRDDLALDLDLLSLVAGARDFGVLAATLEEFELYPLLARLRRRGFAG